jgi:hypothetical protein
MKRIASATSQVGIAAAGLKLMLVLLVDWRVSLQLFSYDGYRITALGIG